MISVVLTTYNGIKFLQEQLDSIRDQSLSPDEVIILDDCSTDGTPDLVRRYLEESHLTNWHFVQNGANQGWKRNFKKGFDIAQGDLIFPADQDDIWHLDKLERMATIMDDHPEIQVLVSNYHIFVTGSDYSAGLYRFPMVNNGTLEQMTIWPRWHYNIRPGCTYCFRKSFYNEILPLWNIEYAHDGNLWQMAGARHVLYRINEELIDYRRHGDNETSYVHFTRQFRIDDNQQFIRMNEEAMEYATGEECKVIHRIIRFLRIRDDVLQRRQLWKWPILLIRYYSYYNTRLGVFADLVYACR